MKSLLFLAEFLLLALVLWAVLKPKKEKKNTQSNVTLDDIQKTIDSLNVTMTNVEQSTEKSIQTKEKELANLRSDLVKALQLRAKIQGLK